MFRFKWIVPTLMAGGALMAQADLNALANSARRYLQQGLGITSDQAGALELCRITGDNGGRPDALMSQGMDVTRWLLAYRVRGQGGAYGPDGSPYGPNADGPEGPGRPQGNSSQGQGPGQADDGPSGPKAPSPREGDPGASHDSGPSDQASKGSHGPFGQGDHDRVPHGPGGASQGSQGDPQGDPSGGGKDSGGQTPHPGSHDPHGPNTPGGPKGPGPFGPGPYFPGPFNPGPYLPGPYGPGPNGPGPYVPPGPDAGPYGPEGQGQEARNSVVALCDRGVFRDYKFTADPLSDSHSLEHAWINVSLENAIRQLTFAGYQRGFSSVTLMRPANPQVPDEFVYIFDCPWERTRVAISCQTGELVWKAPLQ